MREEVKRAPDAGVVWSNSIIGGGIYRHYKGGLYEVQSLGRLSERPDVRVVVYKSLQDGEIWVRPYYLPGDAEGDCWLDIVRWPDGKMRRRFVLDEELKAGVV